MIDLKSNSLSLRKFTHSQQIIINNSFIITIPLDVIFFMHPNNILEVNYHNKALKGTLISNIKQIINGPYQQKLILDGVGYKVEHINDTIKCILGFSHPVIFSIPTNIEINIINNKEILAKSDSLQDLTGFLHKILQTKPAYKDKYKNKGFKLVKTNLELK